jgi:hypothetical protein
MDHPACPVTYERQNEARAALTLGPQVMPSERAFRLSNRAAYPNAGLRTSGDVSEPLFRLSRARLSEDLR